MSVRSLSEVRASFQRPAILQAGLHDNNARLSLSGQLLPAMPPKARLRLAGNRVGRAWDGTDRTQPTPLRTRRKLR